MQDDKASQSEEPVDQEYKPPREPTIQRLGMAVSHFEWFTFSNSTTGLEAMNIYVEIWDGTVLCNNGFDPLAPPTEQRMIDLGAAMCGPNFIYAQVTVGPPGGPDLCWIEYFFQPQFSTIWFANFGITVRPGAGTVVPYGVVLLDNGNSRAVPPGNMIIHPL